MRRLFHSIRNLNVYLMPVSLLATAGTLLLALLYYPPTPTPTFRPDSPAAEERWRAHADTLFAAMLLDALRQLQAERQPQGQNLMYRFELDSFSHEQPVTRRAPVGVGALIRL